MPRVPPRTINKPFAARNLPPPRGRSASNASRVGGAVRGSAPSPHARPPHPTLPRGGGRDSFQRAPAPHLPTPRGQVAVAASGGSDQERPTNRTSTLPSPRRTGDGVSNHHLI